MPNKKKIYEPDRETDRAKNVKGEIIYIDDAESGRKGYSCIGCDKPMQANIQRKNPTYQSYFSHIPVDVSKGEKKCTYSNREQREIIASDILQRVKRIKVPDVVKYPPKGIDKNPVKLKHSKFIDAFKVRSELTFYEDKKGIIHYGKNPEINDRYLLLKPDVTFFNEEDDPILFIELVVTHKINDEKKIKLRRLGINTISIIIPRGSDQEIEENFKSVKNVKWEYNEEEASTTYVSVANRATEGILEFDKEQRRIFGENANCRKNRIRNTIRTITKCLGGKSYQRTEQDFRREIFRVKEATKREEKELAELESKYQKEIRAEYAGRNLSIEKQGRELDSKEESLQLEIKDLEGRYHSKREQLEAERREIEDFEFSKRQIEERIGKILEDREQIEERVFEEIKRDSSKLTKRTRALLEARRFLRIYSTAKRDNERYQRAYELFRKGTWEKG